MTTTAIAACAAVAALIGLIAYAVHRARTDPLLEREVLLVDYLEADRMLRGPDGWTLAREEDFNSTPGKVYLQRWVEKAKP